MTPADIIALALLDAGVVGQGQAASGEDTNNAFSRMNSMLSQWRRKRWLTYRINDVSCTSTGATSYTVYAGGDFNIPRPDRIETAFFRQLIPASSTPVDYPLTVIQAREDYNQITLKTMGTWPSQCFYDPVYPQGLLYVWPVPAASLYSIHIGLKQDIPQYANLADDLNLPLEYENALRYNLAVMLTLAYGREVGPTLHALAKDSLNVIRESNQAIATLRMPSAVVGRTWGYNVYSDQP